MRGFNGERKVSLQVLQGLKAALSLVSRCFIGSHWV